MNMFGQEILPVLRDISGEEFFLGDLVVKIGKIYLNFEKTRVYAYTIEYKIIGNIKYFSMEEDITTLALLLREIINRKEYHLKLDNVLLGNVKGVSSIFALLNKNKPSLSYKSEKNLARLIYFMYFKRDIEDDLNAEKNAGFLKVDRACNIEAFYIFNNAYAYNEVADYKEIESLQVNKEDSTGYAKEIYLGKPKYNTSSNNTNEKIEFFDLFDKKIIDFILVNIKAINDFTFQKVVSIIYDLNGKVIGCKYKDYSSEYESIELDQFEDAGSIFYLISEKLEKFLKRVTKCSINIDFESSTNFFSFRNIKMNKNNKDKTFAFNSTSDLIDFLIAYNTKGKDCYYLSLITECMSLYTSYLLKENNNYVKMIDNIVLNLKGLRYLTTGLAEEVAFYIRDDHFSVNLQEKYEKFIENYSMIQIDGKKYPCYNEYRFKNLLFLDELEEKYEITKIDGKIALNDDSKAFVHYTELGEEKSNDYVKKLYNNLTFNLSQIKEVFPELEQYCVTTDEIVYSLEEKDPNDSDIYKFEGYISSKKVKGRRLTEDYLEELDNKTLAYLNFTLFKYFKTEYISLDSIFYDSDTKEIFIDILSQEGIIYSKESAKPFLSYYANKLNIKSVVEKVDTSLTSINDLSMFEKYNSKRANYCTTHNYFYKSSKKCPICNKYTLNINGIDFATDEIIMEDEESSYIKRKTKNSDIYIRLFKNNDYDLMKKIEKSIPNSSINSIQKIFSPIKVVKQNEKVVGYTYNYQQVSNLYIDLKDMKNTENRIKVKGCIKLIDKVIYISIRNNYSFYKNPFGKVLFIDGYQDAIIPNIVYLVRDKEKKLLSNTAEYTINYVISILVNCLDLDFDITKYEYSIEGLVKLKNDLHDYVEKLTKFCKTHGYYNSKYIVCPHCVDIKTQEEIIANSVYLDSIKNDFYKRKINEGGEATLYEYSENKVIKVFNTEGLNFELKAKTIASMLRKREAINEIRRKMISEGKYNFEYVTIGKVILDRNNNLHSYFMEKIDAMNFSILKNRKSVEELGLSRKDIIEILINAGKGIEYLHSLGIYIGDLNSRNIMFKKNKKVYFIDFDGMSTDEISNNVCTDYYIDPLSKKNLSITEKDDWYSFAIQAFYYLTYFHPFNGIESNGENDVEKRMEKRKSSIDNPDIELPSVAIKWDWMPKEMIDMFKETFNGECRESIVPLLEDYYDNSYEVKYNNSNNRDTKNNKETEIDVKKIKKQKNSVVVEDITDFKYPNAYRIFRDNVYISIENGDYIANFIDLNTKIRISKEKIPNLVDAIVNKKTGYLIYNRFIDVISEGKKYYSRAVTISGGMIVASENKIYYTGPKNVINEVVIENEKPVYKHIVFEKDAEILAFMVVDNSKFLTIKKFLDNNIKVYCNDMLFYEFDSYEKEYNIVYDERLKNWFILRVDGKGLIIYNDGKYKDIEIPMIDSLNFRNVYWEYGYLYIPIKDRIIIIDSKDNGQKEIEINGIVNKKSRIEVNDEGFEIINETKAYKCTFN